MHRAVHDDRREREKSMEFHTKVQFLEQPEHGRRTIVISDIHAHRSWLERLLKKIDFSEKDMLIILGDMIEKGPESLETIRYIMQLCEKHTVYPMMGNVDLWRIEMLLAEDGSLDKELYETNERMRQYWKNTFFQDLCREAGVTVERLEDIPAARAAILSGFQKELDFMKELPSILVTPSFLFVHGGLVHEKLEDNFELPPFSLLKNDDFISQGKHFDKYVVVGHWPVCLYRSDIECSAPYISREQKIISIDGGCGIKRDDQLNALILSDLYTEETEWESVDDFPEAVILEDQKAGNTSINIRYYESGLKILEPGPVFSLAEHVKTGYQLKIYNGFLEEPPVKGKENTCWEYTDYQIPLKKGDRVSILQETPEGTMVRKRGVTGWYYGKFQIQNGTDRRIVSENQT